MTYSVGQLVIFNFYVSFYGLAEVLQAAILDKCSEMEVIIRDFLNLPWHFGGILLELFFFAAQRQMSTYLSPKFQYYFLTNQDENFV